MFRGSDDPEADRDALDTHCKHGHVVDIASGETVCAFRMLPLRNGAEIGMSYAAQFYDLASLSSFASPMVEIGRFCVAKGLRDPDILRVAWGALTLHVDRLGAGMLFGCSSFSGTEPGFYRDAFTVLRNHHLAPQKWRPRVKAPRIYRFGDLPRLPPPDLARAARIMPPLLRSYLTMGGWVSDHAVVDEDLGTLHVFTGVEIDKVPQNRARLLRAMAREV